MANTDGRASGNTANYILCEEGCFQTTRPVLHAQQQTGLLGRTLTVLAGQTGRIYNNQTREFYMPDDDLGPKICPVKYIGTVKRVNTSGNPTHTLNANAGIGGGVLGRCRYEYRFPYKCDVLMRTGSLNGTEYAIIRTNVDEFHRTYGGVTRVSGQDYNNLTFHDGNSQGPYMYYRDVDSIDFELNSANNLSSGFSIYIVKSNVGLEPVQCRVPMEHPTPCGAGTRPITELWTAQTNYAPNWIPEKPLTTPSTVWEFSSDGGVTWGSAPAVHPYKAALQNRWRLSYTIPTGFYGHYRINVRGGDINTGSQYWYDGALMNTSAIPINDDSQPYGGNYRDTSWYMPVEAGAHTFEFHEAVGASTTAQIDLHFVPDYRGVYPERRGFQRMYCVDETSGLQVGLATDINHDGTPYVPSALEDEFHETY